MIDDDKIFHISGNLTFYNMGGLDTIEDCISKIHTGRIKSREFNEIDNYLTDNNINHCFCFEDEKNAARQEYYLLSPASAIIIRLRFNL